MFHCTTGSPATQLVSLSLWWSMCVDLETEWAVFTQLHLTRVCTELECYNTSQRCFPNVSISDPIISNRKRVTLQLPTSFVTTVVKINMLSNVTFFLFLLEAWKLLATPRNTVRDPPVGKHCFTRMYTLRSNETRSMLHDLTFLAWWKVRSILRHRLDSVLTVLCSHGDYYAQENCIR